MIFFSTSASFSGWFSESDMASDGKKMLNSVRWYMDFHSFPLFALCKDGRPQGERNAAFDRFHWIIFYFSSFHWTLLISQESPFRSSVLTSIDPAPVIPHIHMPCSIICFIFTIIGVLSNTRNGGFKQHLRQASLNLYPLPGIFFNACAQGPT